jgi:hypothetical protein
MPVPFGQQVFTYVGTISPTVSGDPAEAKPIGFGVAALGSGLLDLKVKAGPFDGLVNASLMVFAPSLISDDLGFMDLDGGLGLLSAKVNDEVQAAVRAAQESEGGMHMPEVNFSDLVLWKKNVTELDETIVSGPVSALPAGLYVFVLDVKSPDNASNLYRWISYLVVH